MRFLYSLLIYGFKVSLFLYGLFNTKVRQWNTDRSKHFRDIQNIKASAGGRKIVWMHCASLGEYEQGMPLIKAIKEGYPGIYVLVSFFSPSGFEHRKSNVHVDEVIYIPLDTLANGMKIAEILKPILFIGVRYEFWWNLIHALKIYEVPIVFISVVVKSNFYFLKGWPSFGLWLQEIDFFFTQDELSTALLKQAGCKNVYTAGDTRALSVMQRLESVKPLAEMHNIIRGDKTVIIYGSIYLSDMSVIGTILNDKSYFHVVVPHNVSPDNIKAIASQTNNFPLLTKLVLDEKTDDGIVVDTVGQLFGLYQYGDIVYIGGGFEKNIHNMLEPAVFGLPIAIGPKHALFVEAQLFLSNGMATEVANASDFRLFVEGCKEGKRKKEVALLSDFFFKSNSNSIQLILNRLKYENILLKFN
jgi:3-deoxy-D-manno-octulosonic-acid transferase